MHFFGEGRILYFLSVFVILSLVEVLEVGACFFKTQRVPLAKWYRM